MEAVRISNQLSLMLAILLVLSGCGSEIKDAPYPVIDTGYWPAQVNSLAEPLWLDNERILFTSTENLAPGKPPYRVKILNVTTGTITSTRFHTAFCVRDGVALFQEKDEASGKVTDYRGTPEHHREEPPPPPDTVFDRVFDCDWVPKESHGQLGFARYPAKSKLLGENYIEILEPRTRLSKYQKRLRDQDQKNMSSETGLKGKAIYHTSESDSGRSVPVDYWIYSEYLDAYISSGYYDPGDLDSESFHILERDGSLKVIPYPRTVHEGRLDVKPVRSGYLVEYHNDPEPGESPFNKALYLLQGERMRRLIAGSVHGVHISPDGCKAAFVHALDFKADVSTIKPYRTVKLINFCQGGKTP